MTPQGRFAEAARPLSKRMRTRAGLMDAAVHLFARHGFEATSVAEVARLAGLANGTFYSHFRDKDELAASVTLSMAREVVRQLDAAMSEVTDARARTSLATRRFVDLAQTEPDWGRALVRAMWLFRDLREGLVTYLRADLQRGVDQGVFDVTLDEILIDTLASMSVAGLFHRLEGESGPDTGPRVAELQLKMLGVPAALAHEFAWREVEPLAFVLGPRT